RLRGGAPPRDPAGCHPRRGAAPRPLLQCPGAAGAAAAWARGVGRSAAPPRRVPGGPVELRQALTAALLLLVPGVASAQVERFAVVVGNDLGEPPDVPLRYAEMDAARMASVLQEVGGVRPENVVLLQGKDADTVRRSLIAVNERVRSAGRQTVL